MERRRRRKIREEIVENRFRFGGGSGFTESGGIKQQIRSIRGVLSVAMDARSSAREQTRRVKFREGTKGSCRSADFSRVGKSEQSRIVFGVNRLQQHPQMYIKSSNRANRENNPNES